VFRSQLIRPTLVRSATVRNANAVLGGFQTPTTTYFQTRVGSGFERRQTRVSDSGFAIFKSRFSRRQEDDGYGVYTVQYKWVCENASIL